MGIPGLQTQARLGRYELLARLATGGMGEIFLARLEGAAGFEKLYVVKRILPHLADDTRFRQMLIAEARIAAKLSHANICQVYELGETDGQLYIVMEYLEGVSLLPLLRRAGKYATPLELGLVAGVVQQACDALHYAHELRDRGEPLGLVHRDVTPSNIYLTESGVAKLLDFGIAKARGASTNTQEGTVKGKYAYMAPEQLRGGEIDRRVDLFALGIVVFEMLALRRLFQRKTDYLTFRAVMEQPIPDIRRYRPDVPESVALVLARALDRDPGNRFDSARQLGGALLDALGGMRPWTQGELGDFLRANLGDMLARRTQAVQEAIHRKPASAIGRSTMPVIATSEPEAHEGDSEDDFPSVETDVDVRPQFPAPSPSQPYPRAPSHPAEFVENTPPSFGAETTGNALRIEPVRGQSTPTGASQIVVVKQRSLVWPLLAVGLLAVAGGALYLVYEQSQRQQAPTSVVIQQAPDDRAPAVAKIEPPAPTGGTDPTPSPTPPTPPPVPPPLSRPPAKRPANPYLAAIEGHLPNLSQCLRDHSEIEMPAAASASIVIAPNGHTKSVTWKPDALNSSPLGGCLKNVLMTTTFPTSTGEATLTWAPTLSRSKG
ncbi:MAG: serine/threonine protein kinase [Acidobacteriota bacterium]